MFLYTAVTACIYGLLASVCGAVVCLATRSNPAYDDTVPRVIFGGAGLVIGILSGSMALWGILTLIANR